MTEHFKMDKVQPRLLDRTGQGVIGRGLDRPEGPLKVSGGLHYAAEVPVAGLAHGVLVRATITKGAIEAIDEASIAGISGVLGVWSDDRFIRNCAQGMAGAAPVRQKGRVSYLGEPVALVVAETFEAARDAAERLEVRYAPEEAEVDPEAASVVEERNATQTGDVEAAIASAAARIDATYRTAGHAAAAMEPHASIAIWEGEALTLHGSYQMLAFNRKELADCLGVDPDRVRVLSPHIGGGFGSKLGIGPEAVAAAFAARDLDRPVRVVMSRQQEFEAILRRTETRQRIRLAAEADGRLTAIVHEDRVSNLPHEAFSEPVAQATHFLYAGANRAYRHEVARIHRPPTGSVRAPGEAVGMLALEEAMDELAEALEMDPVALRLANIPASAPEADKDFTVHSLAACLEQGAAAFGWQDRRPAGTRREGDWFVGMGVSAAARSTSLLPSSARVVLTGDRARVETDMTDIGTGTYTILAQIAAEMLGLPMARVTVHLGDTDLPAASGSGGSFGAISAGSSVFQAAKAIRAELARRLNCGEDDLALKDGRATGGGRDVALAEFVGEAIEAEAKVEGGALSERFMSSGFGAHFCEAMVHAYTGEVRVRRMLGVFAAGRILNEKTARSQCHGGMIWGLGSALTEGLEHDPRDGHIVSRDLATYHVPAHLDVPQLDVRFIEERDDQSNPIQAKGIGELGISGAGAAVANAVYNACGARARDYPLTPDKVLAAMAARG